MNSETDTPAWPVKRSEFRNHHMDSTRWNGFPFRDDDIIIATWGKAGTTWMQQIVAQLLFDGDDSVPIMAICPWVEQRGVPLEKVLRRLERQTHRRFLKTHLPVDQLVFHRRAKYIYIARDGRDTLWSWFNHHHGYTDAIYTLFNNAPDLVGPPLERPGDDIVAYFHAWLDGDGYPAWPFFSNVQSWFDVRELPNVLLLHFNELKRDLPGVVRQVASFLDITVNEQVFPQMVEHCTFDYMKTHADRLMPHMAQGMAGGGQRFIHKGTNGRWREILGPADIAKYEAVAARELTPACARWLADER